MHTGGTASGRKGAGLLQPLSTRRIGHGDGIHPLALDRLFPDPSAPLELDVGFGKGRFLLARAQAHPGVRFLGIERRLGRLRRVDRKACRMGLENVRILRFDAWYALMYLVPTGAVRTCYVFFPDPWPKARHATHRLFDAPFVRALYRVLCPGGIVQAATDHTPYADQIAAAMTEHGGFEPAPVFVPCAEEQTDFEQLYLGRKPIGRCAFAKRSSP